MRVLVTGATGFLGQSVIPLLRTYGEAVGLSRASGEPGMMQADLTLWNGGLEPESLQGRFDWLLHLAAVYDLRIGEAEAHRQNVAGTHSALAIAQKAGIRNFAHASTVGVAVGDIVEPYPLDRLEVERSFPDHYSSTKALAELMVRNWDHGFDRRVIFRLGVIAGDSLGNPPSRMDGPYHAFSAFERLAPRLTGSKTPIPVVGDPERRSFPIVPVDCAARGIAEILKSHHNGGGRGLFVHHLVPSEGGISARDFYEFVLSKTGLAGRELLFLKSLPDDFQRLLIQVAAGIPRQELAYLISLPRFDAASAEGILGRRWCPSFSEYSEALWRGYRAYSE